MTPCYSGTANIHFTISLLETVGRVKKSECGFYTIVGNSILVQARNALIAKALAFGADKIVMIDDDISWHHKDFERLILAPEKIVAGVYQKRPHFVGASTEFAVSVFPEGMTKGLNGLVEVDGAATGFMRVDREVFEAMKPHCMKLGDKTASPEEAEHLFEFFAFGKQLKDDGKTYLEGEDYNFCRRARHLGFKTYIDPEIKLGHHVGQFKFGAHLPEIQAI